MGLRCQKWVGPHPLLENAHDSNLLPDISEVDYLAANLGPTNLRPLPELPGFVDDIYVFGYLRREDCIFRGWHLSCRTDKERDTKRVVASIGVAVKQTLQPRGTFRSVWSTWWRLARR